MKKMMTKKKTGIYRTRLTALVLTAAMVMTSFGQTVCADETGGAAPSGQTTDSVIDRVIAPDGIWSTGGMLQPPTFSEEEILEHMVSEEEESAFFSAEQIASSEEELNADLLALYEEEPESLCVDTASVSGNDMDEITPDQLGYATTEDAARFVRQQMVKRKTEVTVRLAKGPDSAQRELRAIVLKAMTYYDGCGPKEGDYLYWNIKGSPTYSVKNNNSQSVTYRLKFTWRSGASQEAWVDNRIAQVVSELGLKNPQKSDYEKVTAIYDFIMDTVDYDHDHFDIPYYRQNYMPMYTSYEALKNGKGVCQAYALIFYRLCMESGIPARLIAGINQYNAAGRYVPTHGWNIVKIGDYYYNVDATWDDETSGRRSYFLKNMDEFLSHPRDAEYDSAAFHRQFPMAATSYRYPYRMNGRQNLAPMNKANIAAVSLTTADGTVFSTAGDGKKTKALIFLNGGENGSMYPMAVLSQWDLANRSDCDVAYLDTTMPELFAELLQKAGKTEDDYRDEVIKTLGYPNNLSYIKQSDQVRDLRNRYAKVCGGTQNNTCTCVLIDADNKIQYYGEGMYCVTEAEQVFGTLRPAEQATVGSLAALQTGNNKVALNWVGCAGARSYYIYRKCGAGNYQCVGSTQATAYVNEIPGAGSYTYKVYAHNGSKFFAESKEATLACTAIYHKKGQVLTVKNMKYKVLASSAQKKTVAFAGTSGKAGKSVYIPDKVTIDGITYQVKEIAKNAMKNQKNVKTVSIGKNVTSIGSGAFQGCSKLTQIVVEGKSLKKIGKNAFKKTAKKAVVYVPGSSYKKYKGLFKKKGLSAKASIKK